MFNTHLYSKTQNELIIDSLMSEIDESKLDTNQAKLYLTISARLRSSDPNKSIDYVKKGIEISKKLNWRLGIADGELNLAVFYAIQNDNPNSLKYFYKALKYHEDMNNEIQSSKIYNNLSILHKRLENYPKAIEYVEKALEINTRFDRKKGIRFNLNSLGIIHRLLGNHDKAINYFQKSLELTIELKDRRSQAQCLGNIGIVYDDKKETKKALEFFLNALEIKEEIGDNIGIANSHNNIAGLYIDQIEDKATGKAITNMNISKKNNLLNKAIDHYKISLDVSNPLGMLHFIEQSLYNLAKAYSYKNENALAYETLLKYIDVHDSLVNVESKKIIATLEAQREVELKQKEIVLLKKSVEYQTNITYYSIAVSILIFTILVVLFFFYRSKRKSNFNLEVKNEIISRANNELEALNNDLADKHWQISHSEKQLKETNATKDKFFSIIAHDLKNPLGAFRDLTGMLMNEGSDFTSKDKEEIITLLNQSAKQLFELLENLLDWSRSQTGSIDFNPHKIDISDLINNNIGLLSGIAERKNIELAMESDNETYANVDINMINTVIRNLISNAIKFTPKNGKIILRSEISEDEIKVLVRDNGIGISENSLSKLFRIDVSHSTIGTSNERGTGLGLILCKEFVEKHGGRIWVESEKDNGSTFFFTVPKVK
jgi:signal transduction histidine kinase